MTIEEAIKCLERAKEDGVKNIVLAFWAAVEFDRPDDEKWAEDSNLVEETFDWSYVHGHMSDLMDQQDNQN